MKKLKTQLHSKFPGLLATLIILILLAACGRQPGTQAAGSTEESLESVSPPAVSLPADPGEQIACILAEGETVDIEEARLYIEYNATDGDLGVHGAIDDSGWSEACLYDPNGRQLLAVKPQGQFKDLTMASLFFESREPELKEFSFPDLAAAFPEGDYEIRAISFDGQALAGVATFSHNVPAAPVIFNPELVEDEEDAGENPLPSSGLVVEWEEVNETFDGNPLAITGYEVIITRVDHDDPHGFSRPIYDVHLTPDRKALTVPSEFLEPGTVYELEILALETTGNQTISVGFFETE